MYLGVLILLLGETALFESVALLEYTAGWFVVVYLAWMPTEGKLANKNDSSHPKPSCIPVLVSDFTPCSAEVPG